MRRPPRGPPGSPPARRDAAPPQPPPPPGGPGGTPPGGGDGGAGEAPQARDVGFARGAQPAGRGGDEVVGVPAAVLGAPPPLAVDPFRLLDGRAQRRPLAHAVLVGDPV